MFNFSSLRMPTLVFILMLFSVCNTLAQNKVVVIPLDASSDSDNPIWAVVRQNGILARSSTGVISSERLNNTAVTGDYAVVFNKDISNCVYQATAGSTTVNVGPQPGYAMVANWAVNPTHGVVVFVKDHDGAGTETRSFHLLVTC